MGKRINIGIYIGPNDLDIAAWLNMLQENGLSRATWVRGLLCAHSLGKPLSIGSISVKPPKSATPTPSPATDTLMFGVGDSQAPKRDKYGYGWQVRGPNKEFIVGSVANISISKNEVLFILDEVWANGHAVATFVKSLIRQSLTYDDTPVAPSSEELRAIFTEFNIAQANVKLPPREERKRRRPPAEKKAHAEPPPVPEAAPVAPVAKPSASTAKKPASGAAPMKNPLLQLF